MNSSPTGRRQLFARLSVFSGGFDLEAAATVCAGGGIVSGQISSTRSRTWWTSRCWRWSAGQVPRASGCLISSASTPPSVWPRRPRASRERTGIALTFGSWPSAPTGSCGRWSRACCCSSGRRSHQPAGGHRRWRPARAPDDALAMVGALGLYWRVRGRLAEGATATEQEPGCRPRLRLPLDGLSPWPSWSGFYRLPGRRFRPHAVLGHLGAGDGCGDWRYPFQGTRAQSARARSY